MNARPLGAGALGVAGAALLLVGGAPWPAALLAGAGVVVFALVRTVPGVWSGFSVLLAGAVVARGLSAGGDDRAARSMLPWLAGLELYGIATIVAVRAVREPVRISRRLLGAWLASTGALIMGLALSADGGTAAAASVLVAVGLMYKLGVVPAFAWAPMLLRHPSRRIMAAGTAGVVLAYAVLFNVVPLLGDPANAGLAILLLSAATTPWAAWHVARQWRTDRRCAVTYAVVALVALSLMWQVARVLH